MWCGQIDRGAWEGAQLLLLVAVRQTAPIHWAKCDRLSAAGSVEASQIPGDLARPRVLAGVLRRRRAGHLEALESVRGETCPVLRAGELDVKTAAALGWQIGRRLPLGSHAKGAVDVLTAEADGDGDFVDADRVRAERRAKVDAFARDLVTELVGMLQVGIGGVGVARTSGNDGGPHVESAACGGFCAGGRCGGGFDRLLQCGEADGVGAGCEKDLGPYVCRGGLNERIGGAVGCPAHQVE